MKVVFLLDNNEYVEVAPEKLQIRQIADGVSALGTEVVVPVKDGEGKVQLDEAGQPVTQVGFRPFINYNVNLVIPAPTAEVAPAGKKTGKAKRKAN